MWPACVSNPLHFWENWKDLESFETVGFTRPEEYYNFLFGAPHFGWICLCRIFLQTCAGSILFRSWFSKSVYKDFVRVEILTWLEKNVYIQLFVELPENNQRQLQMFIKQMK